MRTIEFYRLVRHLNYRRSFPTPTSAIVRIPSFPFEAFDNTGTKVQPWSLMKIFESNRAFLFGKHPSIDCPDQSFLDKNELLQDNYTFIASGRFCIQKPFNTFESPKFPLYVRSTLQTIGKSSKCVLYELFHEGSDTLYVSFEATDVLVCKVTRKPVSYPDWWLQKYGEQVKIRKGVQPLVEDQSTCKAYTSEMVVRNSEIDAYGHVNWVSFIKYCCDNLYDGIAANAFPDIKPAHWHSGFKGFEMVYKTEATYGDNLTVESWQSPDWENRACSRILIGQDVCFKASFTF